VKYTKVVTDKEITNGHLFSRIFYFFWWQSTLSFKNTQIN